MIFNRLFRNKWQIVFPDDGFATIGNMIFSDDGQRHEGTGNGWLESGDVV